MSGGGRRFDYIVVGAGAGGGPLAANLARKGCSVLLLEAGGDYTDAKDASTKANYEVAGFSAKCVEDSNLRWDFFVEHFKHPNQPDSKYYKQRGILYPRAATLGGSTAHNHLVTIYGHDRDWDRLAEELGDKSFSSKEMREHFRRLERCLYRDEANPRGHGLKGWLATEQPNWRLALHDFALLWVIGGGLRRFSEGDGRGLLSRIRGIAGLPLNVYRLLSRDLNDAQTQSGNGEGVFLVPQSAENGRRNTSREYVRETAHALPDRLVIKTHTLVTRIVFDGKRAVRVIYLQGPDLYRADRERLYSTAESGVEGEVEVNGEVILCAGAFNTPQILMLSGVGPKGMLAEKGISVVHPLPGVGKNLQDRYEFGVITQMKRPFRLTKNATFKPPEARTDPDPAWEEWQRGKGVYATHGVVLGIAKRSSVATGDPDLFIFGLPTFFKGYEPGFSQRVGEIKDHFTWIVLKAHTRNRAGEVTLRSIDPREPPIINFNYFDPKDDPEGKDVTALVEGVRFARGIMDRAGWSTRCEIWPGRHVASDEQIAAFVKKETWGHHACGTCKMGPASDKNSVVDGQFKVHGLENVRIVDASVFPAIPGLFIMVPVYMLSEKASKVIP